MDRSTESSVNQTVSPRSEIVTNQGSHRLILSLFPNIGLLDRAFEEAGFCVVRGPDKLWGGDIINFHPPKGVFLGIIGGPPCQDFSSMRRVAPTGYGLKMLEQFASQADFGRDECYYYQRRSPLM